MFICADWSCHIGDIVKFFWFCGSGPQLYYLCDFHFGLSCFTSHGRFMTMTVSCYGTWNPAVEINT